MRPARLAARAARQSLLPSAATATAGAAAARCAARGISRAATRAMAAPAGSAVAAAANPASGPSGPSSAAAAPRVVEVEKKVRWTPVAEQVVTGLGYVDVRGESFTDSYFDDANCTLTLADYWLRRRDNAWELKLPASSQPNAGLSRYEEQGDEAAIVESLEKLYALGADHTALMASVGATQAQRLLPVAQVDLEAERASHPRLVELLQRRQLFPVAHFKTTRRTLRHWSRLVEDTMVAAGVAAPVAPATATSPDARYTVVLDEADYLREDAPRPSHRYFRVAEVELVLKDATEDALRQAEQDVSRFAARLEPLHADDGEDDDGGETGVRLPQGKVGRFLALFRKWHSELLVKALQMQVSEAKKALEAQLERLELDPAAAQTAASAAEVKSQQR